MKNNEIVPTITAYTPIELGLEFAAENLALDAIALAVRVHRQNSRQGTVACKDRSTLTSRSNKKPWRQKGTGRARAGTPRSPLWRGGAVSHGPRARVRTLTLPDKVNRKALQSALGYKASIGHVISLSFNPEAKTKGAFNALKAVGLHDQKLVILYDVHDFAVFFAFSNLSNVSLVNYDSIHVKALSSNARILFLEKDKDLFNTTVKQWLN